MEFELSSGHSSENLLRLYAFVPLPLYLFLSKYRAEEKLAEKVVVSRFW
jgi:hypothetical protein